MSPIAASLSSHAATKPRRSLQAAPFHVKHLHQRYAQLVRSGPSGLFSRGDTARLELHITDGVAGCGTLQELSPATIVDVGSGGGVPGIPIAVELPDTHVHLVESQAWKAAFLEACALDLNLKSRVKVHAVRAEDAVPAIGRESADVGTARALAAPLIVAEYLAPLVRVGGHLVLWSTTAQADGSLVAPNEILGLGEPRLVDCPSELRADGVQIVWPRVAPCADRVPRRAGVAQRRPLR